MTTYFCEDSGRAVHVRRLFTKIARHYDLINDIQSIGMHRLWKHRLVSAIMPRPGDQILDLACGSGDLAFRALNRQSRTCVVGGDFTLPMLHIARCRSQQQQRSPPRGWINLDALALPFKGSSFDAVMMAYGLRNMADPTIALREIARVLKTGGRVAILDFGRPPNPIIRSIYYFFLRTVQPTLGWLFFRERETYRYIYESLRKYPAQEGVSHLMQEAGFTRIACRNLDLGIMSLHTAIREK